MDTQKNELTRRTKLVWSFEASNLSPENVEQFFENDYDVLRVVHDPERTNEAVAFVKALRARQEKSDRKIPLMLDVGTDVRSEVSGITEPKELVFGEKVRIIKSGGSATGGLFEVRSEDWLRLFAEDANIIIGFGNVVLKAQKLGPQFVDAEVVQGGRVYPGSSVHVPETRIAPTAKDVPMADVSKFLVMGVDYLVLPGIVSPEEIKSVRAQIGKASKNPPWIIVKIDSDELYRRVDEILPVVDGVLISRMELAVSMNPATIPMLTKEIIQRCNDFGRIVITASEMLGSMRNNPTPTRAEVSDVANAAIDGTDAVVLSEIVAKGQYATRSLEMMRKIITDVETNRHVAPNWTKDPPSIDTEMDAIAWSAYRTAQRVGAKALVCITKGGITAVRLASFRPPIPIIAVTFSEEVLQRLNIVKGVTGIVLDIDPSIDQVLPAVNDLLLKDSWLKIGDRIIFVSVTISSVGKEASNLFTVQRLS